MTDASLASGASVDTAFPRLILPQSTQREFDATTSPRLGSRLARRPKEQFPYSMQPFQILPPPPGAQQGISVTEANRRLQQAQALSDRQQHFGQLLDLASTGYITGRQCGAAPAAAPAAATPEAEAVEAVAAPTEAAAPQLQAGEAVVPPAAAAVLPVGVAQLAAGAAQPAASGAIPLTAAVPLNPVAPGLQRLVGGAAPRTLASRQGRGSIRIVRIPGKATN
jgi:hypothetical protein